MVGKLTTMSDALKIETVTLKDDMPWSSNGSPWVITDYDYMSDHDPATGLPNDIGTITGDYYWKSTGAYVYISDISDWFGAGGPELILKDNCIYGTFVNGVIQGDWGVASQGVVSTTEDYSSGTYWQVTADKNHDNSDITNKGSLKVAENGVIIGGLLTFDVISSPPTNITGAMYYDSDDNKLKYYNGSSWLIVQDGSGTVVHNSLLGLQGGTTDEYYHLTSSEHTIATQAATSSVNGYLTSTDWTTFNGKQDALTFGIANGNVMKAENTVVAGEIAKFTSTGLESQSKTEMLTFLNVEDGANNYSLPTASDSVKGGIKVGTGLGIATEILSVSYGTTSTTACVGNDSRLSDARTPISHDNTYHSTNYAAETEVVKKTATKVAGQFDTGTTDPSSTNRLNYDGYFYATKVYGAVYNDYADFWHLKKGEPLKYGYVYKSLGKDCVLCNKRGDKATVGICTDTYGMSVGFSNGNLPIAIGGFALAYVDKPYKAGTSLVSNRFGILTKARFYEKPIAKFLYKEENEKWKDIEVNGRCWIKVI